MGIILIIIIVLAVIGVFILPKLAANQEAYINAKSTKPLPGLMGFLAEQKTMLLDFLIKKLLVYRFLNSKADIDKEIMKKLQDSSGTSNDAEKFSEMTLISLTENEKLQLPEATIAVIGEAYGDQKRNTDKDIKAILLEMDKQRNQTTTQYLDENEMTLENYIINTIKREDLNNVFEKLDKTVLKQQIKIAERFQFDTKDRQKAVGS